MLAVQLILLVILLPLSLGPLGHRLALTVGAPDLLLIATWAFAWFNNRTVANRWALMVGLLLDATSWLPFGFWTLGHLLFVWLIDWSKGRWFEVSSFTHAMIALATVSLLSNVALAIVTQTVDWRVGIVNLVSNVAIGAVVYYLFAFRLQLFGRWAGRQLG